eukprot:5183608-Karenia_brevis.AAC.1
MKGPAKALKARLEELSGELSGGQPVLVLLYLDDVIISVPEELVRHVLPEATAAFGDGLPGEP